jgi:hypothetical protein
VRPEYGGRLELKLTAGSATSARYALSIFSPDGDAAAEAAVEAGSGSVSLSEWHGTPPPPWLEAVARTLLRTAVRTKIIDGQWPRRISRWRAGPRP